MFAFTSLIIFCASHYMDSKIKVNPYCIFYGCLKVLGVMQCLSGIFLFGSFINKNTELRKQYQRQILLYIQLTFVIFLFIVMEIPHINALVFLFIMYALVCNDNLSFFQKLASFILYSLIFAFLDKETKYAMDCVFIFSFVYLLLVYIYFEQKISKNQKVFSVIFSLFFFLCLNFNVTNSQNIMVNNTKQLVGKSDFFTKILFKI